jgi:hypothetical protein
MKVSYKFDESYRNVDMEALMGRIAEQANAMLDELCEEHADPAIVAHTCQYAPTREEVKGESVWVFVMCSFSGGQPIEPEVWLGTHHFIESAGQFFRRYSLFKTMGPNPNN